MNSSFRLTKICKVLNFFLLLICLFAFQTVEYINMVLNFLVFYSESVRGEVYFKHFM